MYISPDIYTLHVVYHLGIWVTGAETVCTRSLSSLVGLVHFLKKLQGWQVDEAYFWYSPKDPHKSNINVAINIDWKFS